ncbi:hypothetical protein [Dyadobacter fermentans]|uniref:Uncharacterized protein n=1 Tax=Dyadobacter fermentans (strain ATCC 700827 / DSM 18053 / CIP 107007 / KCTC 52180 / NS114) TaxID=471854 RepID=C6W7L2_DYAFD|nr:hypothetical protein [Dyadobacter fermentans]ACT96206.1 hypothetical protein Dfer_5006 [Dyadobacter fermentans DSM 18053]
MEKPYIVYSLPSERASQKFTKSTLSEILQNTGLFFDCCTTTRLDEPNEVQLSVHAEMDPADPTHARNEIIERTEILFGSGMKMPIAYHYPSRDPHSTNVYRWSFSKNKFWEAINYMSNNSPIPKSQMSALQLSISYNFLLKDSQTYKVLPDQEYRSNLIMWLSKSNSCSPTIFFPFERADIEFWKYLDYLTPQLPFKLEERYLRLACFSQKTGKRLFKKIFRSSIAGTSASA